MTTHPTFGLALIVLGAGIIIFSPLFGRSNNVLDFMIGIVLVAIGFIFVSQNRELKQLKQVEEKPRRPKHFKHEEKKITEQTDEEMENDEKVKKKKKIVEDIHREEHDE